jgi:hypothetical protein
VLVNWRELLMKAAEVGAEETASMLLDACVRLTNPVIGAVKDYPKEGLDHS